MAHGHKDYGGAAPVATVYTLQDMAELAARLNSPVVHDRRGNVILMESFEGSLAKCYYYTSSGGSVAISSKFARHGAFSCQLNTGPDDEGEAYISWPLPIPSLSQVGFEFSWNKSDAGNLKYIEIELELLDGTTEWEAIVRWVQSTHRWQYKSSAGVWTNFSSALYYREDDFPFNCSKLVVDLVNKKYVRFITNDTVWSLADIDLYSVAAGVAGYLIPSLKMITGSSGASENYIDSVIITQNEP